MAIKAGVGMSRHHNPNLAGREAAEQALQKAGVHRPDFVFMFASVGYAQHPFCVRSARLLEVHPSRVVRGKVR
jgi:hypothetical protein